MPLTADGPLAIVASYDIGALGSKDGPQVIYNWVKPGVAPLLLPWLAILGLLALRPNRRASAWWIWLPLGCLIAISHAATALLGPGADVLGDVITALAAGLGAVWLLSNYLRRQYRFITFLCILPALAGFSVPAFVSQQTLSLSPEAFPVATALAVSVMATAAALWLCGLICRGRYRPFGLYVWLFLLLAVSWLVLGAPIFLIQMFAANGDFEDFLAIIAAGLAVSAVNFAVLLPFLILSSASPFFRERLKALLHVRPEAPPVMPPPLPEAALKA